MSPRIVIILFFLLELSIVIIAFLADSNSLTSLQTVTRFSGSISLFLFSAIFLLHDKPETIHAWLSKQFYLLFAVVHGIYFVALVAFVYLSGEELIPYRVAGGFFAIIYVLLMPVFKRHKESGKISARSFYVVEKVFIYYMWLIFFLTYLPRVQGKMPADGGSFTEHVVLLGWISTLVGMKLADLIQFRKSKSK